MLALGSCVVMTLLMARRPLPSCPAKLRTPQHPTCVEVPGEPPNPNNNVPEQWLDEGLEGQEGLEGREGRPEMMEMMTEPPPNPNHLPAQSEWLDEGALEGLEGWPELGPDWKMMSYTPRVPSLVTETTFWEAPTRLSCLSPSYWDGPSVGSEDCVDVHGEEGELLEGCADVVWQAHNAHGEPNFAAEQPGDDEAPKSWVSPSGCWSYHEATSLTPGVDRSLAAKRDAAKRDAKRNDLSLAAKRKVLFASQRLLKNTSKELAPQHDELESPKVQGAHQGHDATSSTSSTTSSTSSSTSSTSRAAEAGHLRRSLLPLNPLP